MFNVLFDAGEVCFLFFAGQLRCLRQPSFDLVLRATGLEMLFLCFGKLNCQFQALVDSNTKMALLMRLIDSKCFGR